MDALSVHNEYDIFTLFDHLNDKLSLLYKHNRININNNYYLRLAITGVYVIAILRAFGEYHNKYSQSDNATLELHNLLPFLKDENIISHIFNAVSKMTFLDLVNPLKAFELLTKELYNSDDIAASIILNIITYIPKYISAKALSWLTLNGFHIVGNFIANINNYNLRKTYKKIKYENENSSKPDENNEIEEFNRIINEYKNKGFILNNSSSSSQSIKTPEDKILPNNTHNKKQSRNRRRR